MTMVSVSQLRGRRGRSHLRRRVGVTAVAAVGLVIGTAPMSGIAAPPAAAGPETQMVVAAAPLLPAGATRQGELSAQRAVSGVVGLVPRQAAALGRFASAISTPGSTAYHQYLSAGAFTAYFSPSPATVSAVEDYLRTEGLAVSSVSSNRLLVGFRGPAAAVSRAFHTALATYRLAGGRTAFSNTSAISLPARVAPSVQAVVGLDDLVTPRATPFQPATTPRGSVRQRAAAHRAAATAARAARTSGGPVACEAAINAAGEETGLTDTQVADVYGVQRLSPSRPTGTGQTVAIYELEPYRSQDIQTFDRCYFGAAATKGMLSRLSTVAVDGGSPIGPTSPEADLDIDDVSAMAPGARIQVYQAPPTESGYIDDWNTIVSDDQAQTVTSSWGSGCETVVASTQPGLEQLENTIFEQAAVQGQTVLTAAGDSGADGCAAGQPAPVTPVLSVDDPASQPYVTAVGGTTIDRASRPPVEQTWNDGTAEGAGGGGISAVWPQPSWQGRSTVAGIDAAAVVTAAERVAGNDFCDNTAVRTACRQLPDVSAAADENTGITINYNGDWGTIGGTSSSAPLWAAMLAAIDSTAACRAHGAIGFADPSLYAIASVPAEYKASFNDITLADNDNFGISDGLYPATKGYDMATGLGSPRVTRAGGAHGLAYYLCTPGAPSRPTVSSIHPTVISSAAGSGAGGSGAAVTLTITGAGFEVAGAPDVAGITVGTYPVAPFTVVNGSTITARLPVAAVEEGNGHTGRGSGVFDVSVTLTGGPTSRATPSGRLTIYDDPGHSDQSVPVVEAVTPSGGNEAGGTAIHIYGTGFTAGGQASTVTVGSVAATITAATDTELTARVPAYAASGPAATACAAGEDPATDVCQAEVQVHNSNGHSAPAPLLPEYSGPLPAPPGTSGLFPAATEFDYLPTPTVNTYSFVDPSQVYASEEEFSPISGADNEVVLHGTGLGELGLQWVDVGTPGTSAAADDEILSVSPTTLDLLLPAVTLTHVQISEALAAQTLGSLNQSNLSSRQEPSRTLPVAYAPVPEVTSISTAGGKPLGPTAGGTRITVDGVGFYDGPLVGFARSDAFFYGTDYNLDFSKTSPHSRFSFVTTPQLAGLDALVVCTVSGCSGDRETCTPNECVVRSPGPTPRNSFTFYPPGRPSLRSDTPRAGPVHTLVLITGTNLNLVEAVYFGTTKLPAENFESGFNPETGAPADNLLAVLVPNGLPVGRKLDIRVVTAESEATARHPKTAINKRVVFTLTRALAMIQERVADGAPALVGVPSEMWRHSSGRWRVAWIMQTCRLPCSLPTESSI